MFLADAIRSSTGSELTGAVTPYVRDALRLEIERMATVVKGATCSHV